MVGSNVDLWDTNQPAYGQNGTYGAFIYARRSLDIINSHNPQQPLFLYHAWQEAHTPNEAPPQYLNTR